MQDIYDIKGIMLGFPINIVLTLVFLFFLIIIYLWIFKKTENSNVVIDNIEIKEKKIVDFKQMFDELEKNIDIYDDETFYNKLDDILRIFLEQKGFKNVRYMTLEEILKLDISINLKDIFKQVYFKEFDKTYTEINFKKELINKIKNEIII